MSLARKGVRTFDVMMPGIDIDVSAALAFGFAEPASGGRRALTGVRCANGAGFLEQVRKVKTLLKFLVLAKFQFVKIIVYRYRSRKRVNLTVASVSTSSFR